MKSLLYLFNYAIHYSASSAPIKAQSTQPVLFPLCGSWTLDSQGHQNWVTRGGRGQEGHMGGGDGTGLIMYICVGRLLRFYTNGSCYTL